MPKEKQPISTLQQYLPTGSYNLVLYYLNHYKVQLTITKDRKSILGNYKTPLPNQNHRITINGGLNKYSFLITIIHELAHLITFEQYKHTVEPHGKQWQTCYAKLLQEFVGLQIFPNDLVIAIQKTQQSPAASTCAEVHLTKALSKYDAHKEGYLFIDNLSVGTTFTTDDNRIFVKGEKRRTRHLATEVTTKKMYLFSGVYKVKVIDN